ncbi:MAG TPA: hypothetical protein DCS82_04620 [Rhodospirillaceae bacterium]|nr:hypothetical protein [Rhodospirillaceae bacterium]HAT34978.1 hypothetical protein [Rhodospirillaceae bacterium]
MLRSLAVFVLLLAGAPASMAAPVEFQTSSLWIKSSDKTHKFTVELAVTRAQKARGLMFRKAMPADRGMLFDYGASSNITMWMKNTYLPLDMIFIDGNGRISHIVERTIPLSESLISGEEPARAVLELNGGTVSRLALKPGDQVLHRIFGNGPEAAK